ncbi:MAG TPA: HAMP domain-containing sensor histidine kinase [Chitinophagaceae bacterium]|nr:HAMP domain-containing sensor histidine kinase [Chitinophagaceae bacterium]
MLSPSKYIKPITVYWKNLVGDPTEFSLENRLFNAVSIITLAELILLIPFNFIIGLPYISLMVMVVCIIQAYFYYLSRYKKKFLTASIIYCFIAYSFLIANYYLNSGISGPTILGFVMAFILFIAITPPRWHKWWLMLHAVIGCGLLMLEYLNKGIHYSYHDRKDQFTDNGGTYLVLLVCMYFVIRYTLNNYNRERNLAQKNAAAIEVQNAELENLNREKSRLFSVISHDLRAPLNSIQGYLELLTDGSLPEEQKAKIERELLNHTRQTQDMLVNLLSWSKTQLSGGNADLQPLNFYRTVSGTLDMMTTVATKKGITLNNYISPEVQVKADADMLQLVVRNLVHNAIKFTGKEGEISITAQPAQDECFISIKDNGVGIPLEKQKDIFSLKIRSAQGTGKEKGIGLGLFLCRQLIDMQNGKILFKSAPGQGSEFILVLPAC